MVSLTILEGSLRVKEYELSFKYTESSSSSTAIGNGDSDADHYNFKISPSPLASLPMILQLLLSKYPPAKPVALNVDD